MKKIIIYSLLAISFTFINCKKGAKSTAETTKNIQKYTIKQMMDNERVSGGSFSPDNSKLLISSNKSGIYNAYTISINGGNYTPITKSDSTSIYAISYFPKDERMLLRMDDNGNEIFHILLRDTNGKITDLTPNKKARSNFFGWAKDQKGFFYLSNKRDPRYMDLYEMNIATMKPKLIYKNEKGLDVSGISNNKQYLTLSKSLTTNDKDLFLFDRKQNKQIKINEKQSKNTIADFSIDNKFLYYTTDADGEFSTLMKYSIAKNTHEKVLEKNWDITGSYFTNNGKYRVTYINEDAKNTIEIQDITSKKNIKLPKVDDGSITSVGFSKNEKLMRLYIGGSNTPSNLYVYSLENKKLTQLTDVLNKEIQLNNLVKAEVIRYKSFDGVEIPAIYYQPHQATKNNKVPAMVWVHGGPGGQSRQNFSPLIQYIVNHGYAVLAVNNRGSSGYGKTFFTMDDKNHGEKDLQDCVEGKNWLAKQPNIDATKIGIMGGSYGGYMTMAALTYTPEEFAVGVNIYGVTNWLRTLKSIPSWWESWRTALYKELGNPYTKDSIRLRKISPLFHTDKVTKPLMVLQGAKDPRVLQIESDEIVAEVKKNGVPVEYLLFEDAGHGFVKKENQIEAYSKILKFLDTYLKTKR